MSILKCQFGPQFKPIQNNIQESGCSTFMKPLENLMKKLWGNDHFFAQLQPIYPGLTRIFSKDRYTFLSKHDGHEGYAKKIKNNVIRRFPDDPFWSILLKFNSQIFLTKWNMRTL